MNAPTDPSVDPASLPSPSAWCLRFLVGALRGRTIALKPGANLVGSAGECDVMLPGGDVLPQHLVFNVGELVVAVQKVGAATAELNGEPMLQPRRSLVAGDIVSVGAIEFQLDRVYAAAPPEDRLFAGPEDARPAALDRPPVPAPSTGLPLRWIGGGVIALSLAGITGLAAWDGGDAQRSHGGAVNLSAVEQVLAGYPEVETVAGRSGEVTVRGFVESRARREALRQALEPFGARVGVSVVSADEMVEQARRFVSDPGVTVSYAGGGRLVVSGTVEDEAVHQQIKRLAEDLHPTVLVSDKVSYRPKAVKDDDGAAARARWDAWQRVLPARMVGITEDAQGMKYIQLANGSRYYEGSLLRSGAEITRIDLDGLVLSGGDAPPPVR